MSPDKELSFHEALALAEANRTRTVSPPPPQRGASQSWEHTTTNTTEVNNMIARLQEEVNREYRSQSITTADEDTPVTTEEGETDMQACDSGLPPVVTTAAARITELQRNMTRLHKDVEDANTKYVSLLSDARIAYLMMEEALNTLGRAIGQLP
jgi:hypothetical protein